jgi:hypothetical protein
MSFDAITLFNVLMCFHQLIFQRNETEVGNSKRWNAIAAVDLTLSKVSFFVIQL